MPSRLRVFCAMSLDGFIAGENDDLSWLPKPDDAAATSSETRDDHGFAAFLSQIGALLMGRRTFDIVAGMGIPWPYGELPILVPTSRPLPAHPYARAVSGTTAELVAAARTAAAAKDVYVDGGVMIRAVLDANLLDEATVTIIPTILGRGIPLFAGSAARHKLELVAHKVLMGQAPQLTYRVER